MSENTSVLARVGDLPEVLPQGADDMLFGVYQDWVHQNPGNHLDDGITEDGNWQARWENLSVFLPNAMEHCLGKLGKMFLNPLSGA